MGEIGQIPRGIARLFVSPAVSVYWPYLLSAALLALGVYVRRARSRGTPTLRGALAYLLPSRIVCHRSVRHDLALLVINTIVHSFVFVALLQGLSSWLAGATWGVLHRMFGPLHASLAGWPFVLVVTIAVFAMADLAFYVGHVMLHKIPVLWELHKVHHSAPVLTPFTVFRRHPGDVLFDGAIGGVVLGVTYGVIGWLGGELVSPYTVLGVNALLFATLLVGFDLQHSHVWLRYGAFERLLVSPAAHQLHHSDAPEHFDRNFGNMLSIWDRLFGTYIAPSTRPPQLAFGLGADTLDYRSLLRLYVVPLVRIFGGNARRARGTDRGP